DVGRMVAGDVKYALFTFSTYPGGTSGSTGTGTVNVVGYSGNGSVELADATASGTTLATYAVPSDAGRRSIVLDRDAVLALTGGSNWLGLRLQPAATGTSTLVFGPLNGPAAAPVVTFG